MELQKTIQTPKSQAISLWFVGLITALAILPVFLVEIPAMNDYPGHLARMYLLTAIGTPNQNPYYYFYLPFIYPNLAMDLIVPLFAWFINVGSATKTFLILSQILVVSGAVTLEMVVKGRHEFAGFVGAAVLYSLPFAWGFLNFEFGVGLALWGLAAWFALEKHGFVIRLAAHTLFCICLFVSHLVAFGLYGATLFFYELWRTLQADRDWKTSALTFFILTSPAAIILGYFASFSVAGGSNTIEWDSFPAFLSILHGMNGFNAFLSFGNILVANCSPLFHVSSRTLVDYAARQMDRGWISSFDSCFAVPLIWW